MPVTNSVGWVPVAARNAVSSTPTAATPASRVGSSTSGRPWSRTARMIVCQPTPYSTATAATSWPSSPTRRHASARARSVSDARGRMCSLVSDQVFAAHRSCAHRHTRFTQISVTGRPAVGRSRTRTGRRPCRTARTPQRRQNSSIVVVSIACSSSPSTWDTASRTKPVNRPGFRGGNPSIAVAALPSPSTWGLLVRVLNHHGS
jgi:hypothetical protein